MRRHLPLLEDPRQYAAWSEVFSDEYAAMLARRGEDGVLDDYAASSPAEFFAVASETFFERPRALSERHAELYAALSSYYKVDPRTWVGDG